MIAGASWEWWLGFHAVVLLLLGTDALLPGERKQRYAWAWTATLTALAAGFAVWVGAAFDRKTALEFVTGYTIEASLSVDNLFVFLVLLAGFRISAARQRRVLGWGVLGAIVLRALSIAGGVALVKDFEWVSFVFAAILLYAAWRMLRGGSAHAAVPEWIRKMQPAAGSLLPVIVAVEVTDLLFAVDSIPAVLGVSHNPFVIYTSNIAAVLGLRSLYFALSGWLDRLKYLHYGLGAVLGFVAAKMVAARWFEVPVGVSLAVIVAILLACLIFSLSADCVKRRE